ncbi:ammonium transporter Rh type B-like [Paramacrobiotus metropolitanus]|uniref:ammonium transporter Rh type B-like n=1 Tax=Paramacrobiotus metropolitanus TaxID=2943436 RepID=UPI002445D2FC|nr:ammonium transporter Rh type B-like [Paramacrobiotus metropolitanus]
MVLPPATGQSPVTKRAAWNNRKFGCTLALFQIAFVVLFAVFVEYDWDALPFSKRIPDASNHRKTSANTTLDGASHSINDKDIRMQDRFSLRDYHSMYGDVQIMIFCAFGMLISCFKRYGYSSLGIAFVLAAFVVEWSTLMHGFFNLQNGKIPFSIVTLISADFAVAAVLISTCVILGTVSPLQYLMLAFMEVPFYSLNEWICLKVLKVVDVGGSMYLHVFAAFFGLAVSVTIYRPKLFIDELNKLKFGSKWNELIAMVGTLILFIYWPSFNSVFAPADLQNRAVINTAVSLLASCLGSFTASSVFTKDKFSMTVIQNGALAGGVVIGAVADLMIQPYVALLMGFSAGCIAVLGFLFVNPIVEKKLKIMDVCGVQYLHGMPGILAGLASAVVCGLATEEVYGSSFWEAFPAVVPPSSSPLYSTLQTAYPEIKPGYGRTPALQAAFQLLSLLVSVLIAVASGLFCGMILRLKYFDPHKQVDMFDDEYLWNIPRELSFDEEIDVKEMIGKLEKMLVTQQSAYPVALKDQLRGLESCLKG